MQKEKLLIIDGNSILSRAYYGIRPLSAPDGTPTNAVYGFLNILLKYLDEETPDYLTVAFDLKAPTFRHKMYDGYKAQRKPAPEDYLAQIPVMHEVLEAMNIKCLELEGYEADDIIGTVSKICDESGIACGILTGDKDDLQLASKNTTVKLVVTKGGRTETTDYDDAAVFERYGVTPREFIDVKGLMGDPSDNIPGVKGVGEKTAVSLIKMYKSLDKIYSDVDELDVTASVKNKLKAGRDDAFLSRTLSEIVRTVPIDFKLDDVRYRVPNSDKLMPIFQRLNFKSFIEKFNLTAASPSIGGVLSCESIETSRSEAIEKIRKSGSFYYYLTDDLSRLYFLVDNIDNENVYECDTNTDFLKVVFEDENIKKCGYDLKRDILRLSEFGIDYDGIGFDVLIAAYIDNPSSNKYDIDMLCFELLGKSIYGDEDKNSEQISMDTISNTTSNSDNGAGIVHAVYELQKLYENKIKESDMERLYYEIELPLIKVLADMQITGMYVDKAALESFGKMLKSRIEALTYEIYVYAGGEFNVNSTKQLGNVLFDKLSLPHGKKTKSGYSTSADVLKKLVGSHPIIEDILEYRTLTKLNSTYVDGLIDVINPKTGRIHSSFNQTVTATGRISSTEPNMQNIPVRTELGREIRKMFTAGSDDTVLVDADYSQIELRVLAHISNDENMCEAFQSGTDIHRQTAAQVFKVPLEDVTSSMRSRAKAVNFGIVYGIGAFSLSQDIHVSRREADEYIKSYLNHYKGVDNYMKTVVSRAKTDGYVSTLYNRRRPMPELKASNKITQAFGERVARNAPIQGTAADIIKIAMVNVYKRLKSENMRSRLILQVHDELIVEAPLDEKEAVENIVREEMQNAAKLNVPLVVDLNSGHSWYDTK